MLEVELGCWKWSLLQFLLRVDGPYIGPTRHFHGVHLNLQTWGLCHLLSIHYIYIDPLHLAELNGEEQRTIP